MRLSWREGDHEEVLSQAELSAAIDTLERAAGDERPIATLVAGSGAELHVGLGDPTSSVVLYFPPDYEGVGSLHSVGDRGAIEADDSDPPLVFYLETHYTEFPGWMAVPTRVARRALELFLESGGELPTNVEWEED